MKKNYDVIVIGGGMVGAGFTALLKDSGLSIAVIEAGPKPQLPNEYALRVSAINAGSDRLLRKLNAWEIIVKHRVSPYYRMVVWDAGSSGSIYFDAGEYAEPYLGHIVENDLIVAALWAVLESADNIEILQGDSLQKFEYHQSGMDVELASGSKISAQLLVGADGGTSRVRQLAGIDISSKSYDQVGIVATVHTGESHQATAWQRFLQTGPVAILPLADGSCSIVWSCDSAKADQLLYLDSESFERSLYDATENRLGEIKLLSDRQGFQLRYSHAHRYIAERLALIGDAAHIVHPLAGQGVNLGFADAAALAQTILQSQQQRKTDWYSYSMLRSFERWRKGENQVSLSTMDTFKRVFGDTRSPVRALRGIGLDIADSVSPLKRTLMGRALGIEGDLPDVMRSQQN